MQHLHPFTPVEKHKMPNPDAPTSDIPVLGAIADKLEKLSTSSPSISHPSSQPSTPGGSAVIDNGTNLGSTMGRKPSSGSQAAPFAMERRGSQPPSRRGSRRGSGVFTTPSGTTAVYHTRTNVSCFLAVSDPADWLG
jgi:hypothetical protein